MREKKAKKAKKPGLVSGALKSGTVWSAVTSMGAFLLAASDFIPPDYKTIVMAAGGFLTAISALRARKAGIEAAEKIEEKVDEVLGDE